MLRRIRDVTFRDCLRSENIRNQVGAAKIMEKVREIRLRLFGRVKRMDDFNPVKDDGVPSGLRGRPRKRWRDNVSQDVKELRMREREFGRPTLPSENRRRRRRRQEDISK